jgi:ABC-type uncharacterized transport system involved in gliding motility auxiliary subunit
MPQAPPGGRTRHWRSRRWQARQWLLLVFSTAGLAGTLMMVQLILSHHNWRLDLTPEKRFTLSEHARKVLQGLDRDVQVVAFLRSDDPRNAEIEDLLTRVHNVSGHVRYSIVDVNRNPAVAREYGVDSYGSLVVESDGRRKDFANPREDLLMEAILQVTRPSRKVVYFLTGHGERDIESNDRQQGYSSAHNALRNEFYDVRPLSLLEEPAVPADASVVVIAGPRKDLLASELMKLSAYSARGGSLLILLDPQSAADLGAFLAPYGVRVGDGVVADPENRLFAGDYLTMVVPGLSRRHPVTAGLTAPPLFSQARPVSFVGVAPDRDLAVKGIDLLHSAPTSWQTTDPEVLRTGVATLVAGRDQPGPVSVGVGLMVRSADAPASPPARMIVLGDSDFANNFFIDYLGDKDLLVNAVNWLAGEEQLVGERPQLKTPGVNQFFVSARQGRLAFVLGTVVEPALFLLVGLVIFVRRRWKG